jgi:serine/threonine protein kinase
MNGDEAKTSMGEVNHCPQCGTPLDSAALAGLCPACLLKQGGLTDTVTDATQRAFVPPSLQELALLFPQLEILELIGKGGMGAVYKARQRQLDRIVALKILPPDIGRDPAFAERFAREARALARLNHPGIVTLYEFGKVTPEASHPIPGTSHLFYFLMEFVDGVNLRQLLATGRISPREALAIVPQICDALQYAHDQGIVHRDIKPENILLDRRGRVKVADFGLAKLIGSDAGAELPRDQAAQSVSAGGSLSDAGSVMGTPSYMAPEQQENPAEVDHRADIYALGVVFYQMLTGELPGKRIEPPSRKVQIDVRLDEVVLRALEKNPNRRYAQASVLKTEVETIAAESPEASNATRHSIRARISPVALAGLTWSIIAFATYFLMFMPWTGEVTGYSGPAWWREFCIFLFAHRLPMFNPESPQWQMMTLLPLGLAAPIGVTVCGWLAVSQIRRSAGHLRGIRLALYDGLLFPILLLDALIFSMLHAMPFSTNTSNGFFETTMLFWLVSLFIIGIVDFLIVRKLWLSISKPTSPESPISPPEQAPINPARWKRAAVFSAIVVVSIALLALAVSANRGIKSDYIGRAYFPEGDSIEITSVKRTRENLIVSGHYDLISHSNASLALDITSTNQSGFPNDPSQTTNVVRGEGTFKLIHPHMVPGLPHVSMYADGKSFATLYFGTREEALEASRASWITNEPASAETWSPPIRPDEKLDPSRILDDAKQLMSEGHYEEALQRHIWYHNHALEYNSSLSAVRLSFALSEWIELGRRYPKAKAALVEIRDAKTREFEQGRGYSDLFQEVSSINSYLQNDNATLALFKWIGQRDSALAQQCYIFAEDALVQNGEYGLCLHYIGDPQSRFELFKRGWEMQRQRRLPQRAMRLPPGAPPAPDGQREMPPRIVRLPPSANSAPSNSTQQPRLPTVPSLAPVPPPGLPDMARVADDYFVRGVRKLVEILVGASHRSEAEKIRDQAVALLDDPRLKSVIQEAEKKVASHAFEAVVEKTLPNNTAIHLDSGLTTTLPASVVEIKDPTKLENAIFSWLEGRNVDFCFAPNGVAYGLERNVVTLKPEEWDSCDPQKLAELLRGESKDFRVKFNGPLGYILGFKNRERRIGLLQITGFTDNPRGVKIRYKLVRNGQIDGSTNYPGDWIWEGNSQTLDRVPPIFLLRPSTLSSQSVPLEMFAKDRCLVRGKTLKELIKLLWSQKNSELKIVFEADLSEDRFEFIAASQPHWWDKLESEINQRFHLVQQIEHRESGDAVVVKDLSTSFSEPPQPRFDVVFERTVPSGGLVSFENGTVSEITTRASLEESDDHGAVWMRNNNIDVKIYGNVFVWYDATFWQLRAEEWENWSPDFLSRGMAANPPISTIPNNTLSATFGFKTRRGVVGVMQVTGFTENPRGVKIRYKLLKTSLPTASQSVPTERQLTEPPQLRFLAWQDEWKTNQPGAARHPDGSSVTNRDELDWLHWVSPSSLSSQVPSAFEPRYLCLWISHPLFGGSPTFSEVKLLDEQGEPVQLNVPVMNIASSSESANEHNGNLGWLRYTLTAGEGTNIPRRVTVKLRYVVGPLERTQELHVTPKTSEMMTLEGNSLLNGYGQNVDGKTFVSIAVDIQGTKARKFGVVAVTDEGRIIEATGGSFGGSEGSGVSVSQFTFDTPLSNVKRFLIGTRPIRTNEWKNVILPGGHSGSEVHRESSKTPASHEQLLLRYDAAISIAVLEDQSDALMKVVKEAVAIDDLDLARKAAREIRVLETRSEAIREIALALKKKGQLHDAIDLAKTIPMLEERDKTLNDLGQ